MQSLITFLKVLLKEYSGYTIRPVVIENPTYLGAWQFSPYFRYLQVIDPNHSQSDIIETISQHLDLILKDIISYSNDLNSVSSIKFIGDNNYEIRGRPFSTNFQQVGLALFQIQILRDDKNKRFEFIINSFNF